MSKVRGTEEHHIAPQEFREYFEDLNIDPDQYTADVPVGEHKDMHRDGWNEEIADIFENAIDRAEEGDPMSKAEVLEEVLLTMEDLSGKYGISYDDLSPYHDAFPSGVEFVDLWDNTADPNFQDEPFDPFDFASDQKEVDNEYDPDHDADADTDADADGGYGDGGFGDGSDGSHGFGDGGDGGYDDRGFGFGDGYGDGGYDDIDYDDGGDDGGGDGYSDGDGGGYGDGDGGGYGDGGGDGGGGE